MGFLKLLGRIVILLIFTVVLLGGIATFFAARSALASAGLSFRQAYDTYKKAITQKDTSVKNILIFGLDKRADFEQTLLTDAIMQASFDPKNMTFNMVSIPRDLWIPELKTKVNALYFYGQKNAKGIGYTLDEMATITGVVSPYYVIVDYHILPSIIDAIGGVTVDVPTGFVDQRFPNPEYATDSSKPVYITVTFDKGIQHMDGDRATVYMRSRMSQDSSEGSDDARALRQTHILSALGKKLVSKDVITNPKTLGALYKTLRASLETNITDVVALAWIFSSDYKKPLTVQSHQIPTPLNSTTPLLVIPPTTKYNQWVYETKTNSWTELHTFFKQTFYGN